MKIIGSSKIDEYKKTVLEDSVLRAINAKPGDSVLFYRKQNDSSVCIYKAEGAQMSSENDAPIRNHLKGAFDKLRIVLIVGAVLTAVSLALIALNYDSLDMMWLIAMLVFGVLALACIAAAIFISQKVDAPFDSQSLVTVGGPYSQNRLTGLSRMTSDGYVISGDLYVNSLFGANPSSLEVEVKLDGAEPFNALVKVTKSVPGYSMYKIRFKELSAKPGSFVVKTRYSYLGKTVVVLSTFKMDISNGQEIKVTECGVEASLEFDQTFNSTEFDDALFSPTDDE